MTNLKEDRDNMNYQFLIIIIEQLRIIQMSSCNNQHISMIQTKSLT